MNLNIYILKTIFFLINSIYLLFSEKRRKIHIDQSIVQVFFLKMNNSHTSKSSSCRKTFSSMGVIGKTCFDECFLFQLIIGRQTYHYRMVFLNRHVLAVLYWKETLFYTLSPQEQCNADFKVPR